MSDPRVSVITIFLDGERFIEEAIESVRAQSFDDWELLLVDDGSTDGSTDIARRWAEKDDRIRYLDHEDHANRGMSATRNVGIAEARGELVAFLDCDDVWLPHHLERAVGILDGDATLDATYCAHRLWFSWTGDPKDAAHDEVEMIGVPPDTVAEPGELLAVYRRNTGAVPAIHAIVARRDSMIAIGGFAEEFRTCFEDQVFFTKLGLHWRVFVNGDCNVLYRQHPDSCCAVAIKQGTWIPGVPTETERRFLEWLEQYLEANAVEGDVRAAVAAELEVYRKPLSRRAVAARISLLRHLARRALGREPAPVPA